MFRLTAKVAPGPLSLPNEAQTLSPLRERRAGRVSQRAPWLPYGGGPLRFHERPTATLPHHAGGQKSKDLT